MEGSEGSAPQCQLVQTHLAILPWVIKDGGINTYLTKLCVHMYLVVALQQLVSVYASHTMTLPDTLCRQ